ncbi:MAG: ROK family protein [Bacillota bacterium]
MERTAGNQVTIKENNQRLIIDSLMKLGATSRAELAKRLKLSAPSVSKNINCLLKKNILREIGAGDSIGGRRPILLEFNYNYGYIIGVDLSGQELRLALGNLKSEILEARTIAIADIKSGKAILDIVADNIEEIFAKNRLKIKQLLAIALGFPGTINQDTGYSLALPMWLYIWDEVNIIEELRKRFKAKVIVKNDINLAALGEHYYGVGKNYKNLAYVSVDMGVGAGVIIENNLYEGTRRAAGEIGYFISNIEDLKHENKAVGPLESRIGLPSLVERVKQAVRSRENSIITELTAGDADKVNVRMIEKAIRLKDPYIMKEMAGITFELGMALANISILLDLESIILGGKLVDLGYDFLTPLNAITQKVTPFNTKVFYSALDQNAIIYGAFTIALEHIQENILKK